MKECENEEKVFLIVFAVNWTDSSVFAGTNLEDTQHAQIRYRTLPRDGNQVYVLREYNEKPCSYLREHLYCIVISTCRFLAMSMVENHK